MSDDRKYRQRGYQDSGPRERTPQAPKKPIEPYDPRTPRDPRVPNMPGFREVFRCTRCGKDDPRLGNAVNPSVMGGW